MKINVAHMKYALNFLAPNVPKSPAIPELVCLKVTPQNNLIQLEATSLITYAMISIPAECSPEDSFLLEYDFVRSYLNVTDKSEFTISVGKRIRLDSRLSKAPMNPANYPDANKMLEVSEFKEVRFDELTKSLGYDKISTGSSLEGIIYRDGYMYATNGLYALQHKSEVDFQDETDFPIGIKSLLKIKRDTIYLGETKRSYVIKADNWLVAISKPNRDYPIIEGIFRNSNFQELMLDKDELLTAIKTVKLAKNDSSIVTIKINRDELILSSETDISDANFIIPIADGKTFESRYNADSLETALSMMREEEIYVQFGASNEPLLIVEGEQRWVFLPFTKG